MADQIRIVRKADGEIRVEDARGYVDVSMTKSGKVGSFGGSVWPGQFPEIFVKEGSPWNVMDGLYLFRDGIQLPA